MNYLCIYHKDCADGFGSALAVKKFCDEQGHECEFVAAQHGDTPPDVHDKHVLIVDFSYKRDLLLTLAQQALSLRVIDHHKSAQQELTGLDFCVFDMSKSGAVLTWDTLLPNRPLPKLLAYIQDRDLWQWQLQDSKEVSAALHTLPKRFELWQPYLDDDKINGLIGKGRAIVQYQQQQIDKATNGNKVYMAEIAGYTVPCINATHLISEIGDKIAQGHPFAAMYFETADKRIYSLRSASDGIDVSAIAQQFGGGGHFHAAGFAIDRPQLVIKA
jgi:oligoribonuclease NrnB/cAMP/cGMP phosphodiesterase (DHH superfamily)